MGVQSSVLARAPLHPNPPISRNCEDIAMSIPVANLAAGKRSHENFPYGSYGGVGEEEPSIQQLRFTAASLSFSSVS
ncbi:hypothetical protein ACFX1Z_043962 [Malus domestica]